MEKTILDTAFSNLSVGALEVVYWDGDKRQYGQGKPVATITFRNSHVVRTMMRGMSLGFGEGYMNGDIDITGQLDELMALPGYNRGAFSRIGQNRSGRFLYKNKTKKQREFIAHHYDLGNDFYELWLDREAMGYTCGYYRTPQDTLEQAQVQKYDYVLRKLQLQKGQRLIDLGCGWGYLIVRAAKLYGIQGVGVTLSSEQLQKARAWAKEQGVEDKVQFELMNYQEAHAHFGQFDRVVSVGMLEHVGRGNHKSYFEAVDKLLVEGGISVLHSITQQTEVATDPWLDKYIFPGGYTPTVREITALLPNYGFYLYDYENIGPHYIPTLRGWWERFEANKDWVLEKYDERFYRMWRMYLAGSIAAFVTGGLDLSHWAFTKGPRTDQPRTREFLYLPPTAPKK
jgi:cyclopropane-fatty-acyl-phospholipid synthase